MNYNRLSRIIFIIISAFSIFTNGQSFNKKVLRISAISNSVKLDGKLNEAFWNRCDSLNNLTMVNPVQGNKPIYRTVVKVCANSDFFLFGIKCYDSSPDKITTFSKARDSDLGGEDHITLVLDTYLDGRSGYIFSVNPSGAGYDALVSDNGQSENSNWDGVWEAATVIDSQGWSAEIKIPVKTLTFKPGLKNWGFNIERKVKRLLENDRWTGISRNYDVRQTNQAGILTGLPVFNLGLGLTIKASTIENFSKKLNSAVKNKWNNSLDISEKITPNMMAQLSINTDFAETEIDQRQTNLTRFPTYYPEKRSFFLEGSDLYEFGLGLGSDVIPFFTRRIGLFRGEIVPMNFGGKFTGKTGFTDLGAVVANTGPVQGLVPAATMGAFRIRENIFKESSIGIIGTFGDPLNRRNSWLGGIDFIYKTTNLYGDKNFLIGLWGLYTNRQGLTGNKLAYGAKIDYPNDLWQASLSFKRIGGGFQPSLGFVPRYNTVKYNATLNYTPRPNSKIFHQLYFESSLKLYTDLHLKWQDYELDLSPLHFEIKSGDKIEFHIIPTGENLPEEFEVLDNIIISKGNYNWIRYNAVIETATKRPVDGQIEWEWGGYYNGQLYTGILQINWKPSAAFAFEINYENDMGVMPQGNFQENLYGGRIQFNYSPDFQISSFIQYDDESRSLGTNTRLRWTFNPLGDLFLVYNHNIRNFERTGWLFENNQLIIKLTYGLWL